MEKIDKINCAFLIAALLLLVVLVGPSALGGVIGAGAFLAFRFATQQSEP